MQCHIPESSWESIAQLIDQAVIVSLELRKPIYAVVSCKAVDFPSVAVQMDKVNWEVKELMSQHSGYVDVLLRVRKINNMLFFFVAYTRANFHFDFFFAGLANIFHEGWNRIGTRVYSTVGSIRDLGANLPFLL